MNYHNNFIKYLSLRFSILRIIWLYCAQIGLATFFGGSFNSPLARGVPLQSPFFQPPPNLGFYGPPPPRFVQAPGFGSNPFPPRCSYAGGQQSANPYSFLRIFFKNNLDKLCMSPNRCTAVNKQGIGLCGIGFICCTFWCGSICVPLFPQLGPGGGGPPQKSFVGANGAGGRYINPELIPKPPMYQQPQPPWAIGYPGGGGIPFPYGKLPPVPPPFIAPKKMPYPRPPPPPIIKKRPFVPPTKPTLGPSCKCYNGQFDCNNGQCLPAFKVCNGFPDCSNGIDEIQAFCKRLPTMPFYPFPPYPYPYPYQTHKPFHPTRSTKPKCKPGKFDCLFSDKCLPPTLVCNGVKDCPGGEDELKSKCPPKPAPAYECFTNQFQCADGSCIPIEYVCDGKNDCKYGKDEMPEFCKNRPTQPPKPYVCKGFLCKNGQCVKKPGAQCDNIVDCMDASDEECHRGDIYPFIKPPIRFNK